jgi:hypothetical protein
MSRPDAKERARAYLVKSAPRAIAGQGGDNTTHAVACTLSVDFGLDDGDVRELLGEYNRAKCEPQWNERDLERHVRSARRTANSKPGEVGKLLGVDREDYTGPRSPANNSQPSKPDVRQAKAPANAPPKGGSPSGANAANAQRTARTAFFTVRRAGEGAEPRTARTIRTLPIHSLSISSPLPTTSLEENKKKESEQSAAEASAKATNPASEVSAPMLRAIPPGAVTSSRDGLRGDVLAVYDALLRRGPMTCERMVKGLGWTAERFAAAQAWLTQGGWIATNENGGNRG